MISVSIVEDLPEIRSGLERLVKEQQDMLLYSVSSNAEEAMPELIRTQPAIVIMDINMPGMDGIDCIRLVKDNCPATQFMIFTIYENDEKIFDALQQVPAGILKKTSSEKLLML
jgi:DNA-binding NarL/FixJ family response regulator